MTEHELRNRFQKAILILASEKGRVKDRLLAAFASQLSEIQPQAGLPALLDQDFREIRYALSDEGMPYGYGEHAARKLDDMSEDEAARLVQRLFAIYVRLVGVEQAVIS